METQVDPTYLKPGLIFRATAVGLATMGIGAGVLLACWGLSFFWHYDSPVLRKLETIDQRVETISQHIVEAVDKKLDDFDHNVETMLVEDRQTIINKLNDLVGDRQVILNKLNALDQRVAVAANKDFGGGIKDGHTITGAVIKREVTVFSTVKHEAGNVTTGWRYKDGASDGAPMNQYCYYTVDNPNGSSTKTDIAMNGKSLPNIGRVPLVEEALSKCQWWANS
jgi:hypothetical protein